jgi:outer membrane protein
MGRIWLNVFPVYAAILLLMFVHSNITCAQNVPPSPERQWLGPGEQQIKRDADCFQDSKPKIDSAKIYSLAELIDFAQSHNPETRFAWERARAQAAALGVVRSELSPTLAAVAGSGNFSKRNSRRTPEGLLW